MATVTNRAQPPTAMDLERFYSDLVGRRLSMKAPARLAVTPGSDFVAAVYRDETHAIAGVACTDVPLGAALGAALTMLPADQAKGAATTGKFPDAVWENLYEVLNITSRWFQPQTGHMVQIDPKIYRAKDLPADARAALSATKTRFDVKAEIPGYGVGTFMLAY